MVNAYNIDAISIGNGTASRETEFFIKKIAFDRAVQVLSFQRRVLRYILHQNRS
jgi:transcriptional accessory protein Tex/SPT6